MRNIMLSINDLLELKAAVSGQKTSLQSKMYQWIDSELSRRSKAGKAGGRPVQFTDEKHVKDRIRRRKDNEKT